MEISKEEAQKSKKYQDLFSLFERIFRSKVESLDEKFGSEVFFLANDFTFQSYLKKSLTPHPDHNEEDIPLMFQILESLSLNNDLRKLKIVTHEFIDRICLELINLQNEKEKVLEKINAFNIDENLNIIEQTTEKLKGIESNKESKIRISIIKLEGFPIGEYSIKLRYKIIKKNNLVDKGIIEADILKSELINKVSVKSSDSTDLKEKTEEFTFPSITLSKVKLNYQEFSNPYEEVIKEFSGTNLSYFEIELVDHKGTTYLTYNQEIIDLFFKLLGFLMDTTQNKNEFYLCLAADRQGSSVIAEKHSSVMVKVAFEVEPNLRRSILKRILKIFKDTVSFRTIIENKQKSLIHYFSTYEDKINEILTALPDSERSRCSDCGCLII